MTLHEAISTFGAEAKSKLSNPGASGAAEDQLRTPLEGLIANLAELTGLPSNSVVAVGETSLADLKTRPDYAVTRRNALIGFIEVKAPGKGADPSGGLAFSDSLAARLRCTPVNVQAARILLNRSSCCCCCACGDVGKARSGLSIISTGVSPR